MVFVKGGGQAPRVPVIELFMRRVRKTPTCWIWVGSVNRGYGTFTYRDENGKQKWVRAARWIWEYTNGPIPDGLQIDHVRERGCVSTRCVNPAHLEPVDGRTNTLRAPNAPATINANKTHCPKGHPYDDENTLYNNRGRRVCRACNRERCRRQYHEKKQRESSD